jgi:hypothetical protein
VESDDARQWSEISCFIEGNCYGQEGPAPGNRREEAKEFMLEINGNYNDKDITVLPTPHGFHVVTPPFNREEKAMKKYFGFAIPSSWIKPDAMAMLYAPDTI